MVEIIVGAAIIAVIGGLVAHWFVMQRRYQQRVTSMSDGQQSIRQATWNMIQELRTARTIISPRVNGDDSIKSDEKVVFKNFAGDIVCFYLDSDIREIKRCLIPNGPDQPLVSPAPIARGIDRVVFTAHDPSNKLLAIYLEADGSFGLESIYALNE